MRSRHRASENRAGFLVVERGLRVGGRKFSGGFSKLTKWAARFLFPQNRSSPTSILWRTQGYKNRGGRLALTLCRVLCRNPAIPAQLRSCR